MHALHVNNYYYEILKNFITNNGSDVAIKLPKKCSIKSDLPFRYLYCYQYTILADIIALSTSSKTIPRSCNLSCAQCQLCKEKWRPKTNTGTAEWMACFIKMFCSLLCLHILQLTWTWTFYFPFLQLLFVVNQALNVNGVGPVIVFHGG